MLCMCVCVIIAPVLKAGHPGVPSYIHVHVCLFVWAMGYFTFLLFLISLS